MIQVKNGRNYVAGGYFGRRWLLCPALPEAQNYAKNLITKLMSWNVDGFKHDGSFIPPLCRAKAHNHSTPYESEQAYGKIWEIMFEETRRIQPKATVLQCNCGAINIWHQFKGISTAIMGDPDGPGGKAWTCRWGAKAYHALRPGRPQKYHTIADYVEERQAFPQFLGLGTVPQLFKKSFSQNSKEEYKKWFDLYHTYMLPKGEYLGTLYDIVYDKPETHVIKKDGVMYYAFFLPYRSGHYSLEFRGLEPGKKYKIVDYVNNIEMGIVQGPTGKLSLSLSDYLLVKAIPIPVDIDKSCLFNSMERISYPNPFNPECYIPVDVNAKCKM
jgi:alpha-galactosidase